MGRSSCGIIGESYKREQYLPTVWRIVPIEWRYGLHVCTACSLSLAMGRWQDVERCVLKLSFMFRHTRTCVAICERKYELTCLSWLHCCLMLLMQRLIMSLAIKLVLAGICFCTLINRSVATRIIVKASHCRNYLSSVLRYCRKVVTQLVLVSTSFDSHVYLPYCFDSQPILPSVLSHLLTSYWI